MSIAEAGSPVAWSFWPRFFANRFALTTTVLQQLHAFGSENRRLMWFARGATKPGRPAMAETVCRTAEGRRGQPKNDASLEIE